jgi:hypothetical protein
MTEKYGSAMYQMTSGREENLTGNEIGNLWKIEEIGDVLFMNPYKTVGGGDARRRGPRFFHCSPYSDLFA